MRYNKYEETRQAAERADKIAAAEKALASAYRDCTRQEMIESQLRVRASVVREMGRRIRR